MYRLNQLGGNNNSLFPYKYTWFGSSIISALKVNHKMFNL